jgi:hypothetical protein
MAPTSRITSAVIMLSGVFLATASFVFTPALAQEANDVTFGRRRLIAICPYDASGDFETVWRDLCSKGSAVNES